LQPPEQALDSTEAEQEPSDPGENRKEPMSPLQRTVLWKVMWFSILAAAGCGSPDRSFRNPDEDPEGRVEELLSRMSQEEKFEQMAGSTSLQHLLHLTRETYNTPDNERLGIRGLRFTDGPRGVVLNESTCFPVPMARGATWNRELEQQVGEAMGLEAEAQGANFMGVPCINVLRHPGWGRAQETYGADPYHIGSIGVALVEGLQGHVMACAKHFAANSIEDTRYLVNVRMDERTLREVYLPHFKRCVDAGIASVMTAYNRLNGPYCSENQHLLREILKEEWNFDGFVISDFLWAVKDTARSAQAGLDVEMPIPIYYTQPQLAEAVDSGRISMGVVEEAVRRILRQKLRFGLLEDPPAVAPGVVAGRQHTQLALEVARQSMVLLKNENRSLPLDLTKTKRIAVLGSLAGQENIGDLGSSKVTPPYVVTPLEGLRSHAGDGVDLVYDEGKDLSIAEDIARGADAVIVFAGLTHEDEGENTVVQGGDRESLDLHDEDEDLIRTAAGVNDRCIVVLEGGSAITMESWIREVEAVVMAWYPGMEGGNAIAEVLGGECNPSGKLPLTFPRSLDQLYPFGNKEETVSYGLYHDYRYFDKHALEPQFCFGHGLSYTAFAYENLRVSQTQIGRGERTMVSLEVTNVGAVAGTEIVQLYLSCPMTKTDRPVQELRGFGRLALEPGEKKSLSFELKAEDLAFYDMEAGAWHVEAGDYIVQVGASSRDLRLKDTFSVLE
jgi:beta-glucosidase